VAKPVDVHAIVLEVIGLLSRSLDPRIVLKPRLQAGKSVIAGDPDQIQNALLNLAINARDAIKETGEIVFETSVAELDARFCRETGIESPPGRFLVVSVSDTGQGMDQETLGHIFEPFFTTKKEGVGTGLGLSAVYGTVKNHLGAVTVYSESGHGTVFKIYLPLPQTEMPRSEERPETEDGKGRGRLLVVEDEAHLRGLLKTVLTRSGYEVTCCADGVEALEHYARRWKETDLVILDMVMPRMNGRETFQKMKEINPSVRAILSSGFSLDGEAAEMRKAGILDFVQKPYLINEILKSVRNGLKG
jgi:CheY-like chemotaxis protein